MGNEPENQSTFDAACAYVIAGLEAWPNAWALVLDLTDFGYEWGDRMQNLLTVAHRWYEPTRVIRHTFGEGPPSFPTAVVTSAYNAEGLASLVSAEGVRDVALCRTREAAIQLLDDVLLEAPHSGQQTETEG